ncbi:hypothetical protein Cgig2_020427 [Carnegiea gigantea]|uniref:Uncharacterized protein n=1 Tax=Carnegiea gigantea TaxID=171969 RepID=A0A9Q1JST4_9CARY|nr:hypothetical protein Cgig2_020427 [Carnegiea gigantea]
MITGKLMVWLVRNFNTSSSSLPLTHDKMRMTEHDVHMTLGLPQGPLEAIKVKNESNVSVEFASVLKHGKSSGLNMIASLNVRRGHLEDSLDKATVTNEEGEVNKEECHDKNIEAKAKVEDQTRVSKVKDSKAADDMIITNRRLLVEVMIELEELLPNARVPLKRVRKTAMEATSDAIIIDTPKKSKMYDLPQFTPPSFNLGVSQEEKQALPKGVVLVDLELDILTTEVQVLNLMERISLRELKEAQIEVVRSIGFASFLKVDLKQIPGMFSKWLVQSFDPYVVCFRLPGGQKFQVTTFDLYLTLDAPIREKPIVEINKSSIA